MAEGNELGGFFSRHGSCDDGGVENGAFFALDVAVLEQCHDLRADVDDALSGGTAAGVFLSGDVHHAGLVVLINVAEVTHAMPKGRSWRVR